uniref:Uncharacterized protein n=1 Tax=viral metagenome TaxID=1070528 RepID=A0A6M3JN45_9ZZZZ
MDKLIKYADKRNSLGRYLQALFSPELKGILIGIVMGDMCLKVDNEYLMKSRPAPMPHGNHLASN